MSNTINAFSSFINSGGTKTYLIKEAGSWQVIAKKPKNCNSLKTLRTILADITTQSLTTDKEEVLRSAKNIKQGYDIAYASSGRKIWQAVRLFFTGKCEKDEIHHLYKKIKTALNIPLEDSQKEIQSEVNAITKNRLLNLFSLPSADRKTVCIKILKPKTDAHSLLVESRNYLIYLGFKIAPKTVYSDFETDVNGSVSIENKSDLEDFIQKAEIYNKVLYTAYKEIYKQSKAPRPWEAIKLATRRKITCDEIRTIYETQRQRLRDLKTTLGLK